MKKWRTSISVAEYCAAFRTWITVTGHTSGLERVAISPRERATVEEAMRWLEKKFRREHANGTSVPIETLCKALARWAKSHRDEVVELPPVGKSCLLSRLIYAGEPLRTRACPIHGGTWSGWGEPCPAGCSFGPNLTGWLPDDHVDSGWPAPPHANDPQLAALEQSLLVGFDDDTLGVYGDRLQALGDPRGELIALELAVTNEEELAAYHRRASAWMDKLARAPDHELRTPGSLHGRVTLHRGFLGVVLESTADVRVLFDNPLGVYLRRATIASTEREARAILRFLAARTHRWLAELSVTRDARDDVAALAARAPNLTKIHLIATTR